MRVLYHLSEGPITEKLGHIMYRIPPGEPTEIADDFHAEKLLERFAAPFGLVEVCVYKTADGTKYDLEKAHAEAVEGLAAGEEACIAKYIKVQLEDRIRVNFPPLPPVGRVAELIKKRNVDLGMYGIRPFGMPLLEATADVSRAEFEALKRQNATLADKLSRLMGSDLDTGDTETLKPKPKAR